MTIISKEPALVLKDSEYQALNDAYTLIYKINEELSKNERKAVAPRFECSLADLMYGLKVLMEWSDEE